MRFCVSKAPEVGSSEVGIFGFSFVRWDGASDGGDEVMERSPLGRFVRFNRKLGSGSYKVVFLGFDNDTGALLFFCFGGGSRVFTSKMKKEE